MTCWLCFLYNNHLLELSTACRALTWAVLSGEANQVKPQKRIRHYQNTCLNHCCTYVSLCQFITCDEHWTFTSIMWTLGISGILNASCEYLSSASTTCRSVSFSTWAKLCAPSANLEPGKGCSLGVIIPLIGDGMLGNVNRGLHLTCVENSNDQLWYSLQVVITCYNHLFGSRWNAFNKPWWIDVNSIDNSILDTVDRYSAHKHPHTQKKGESFLAVSPCFPSKSRRISPSTSSHQPPGGAPCSSNPGLTRWTGPCRAARFFDDCLMIS